MNSSDVIAPYYPVGSDIPMSIRRVTYEWTGECIILQIPMLGSVNTYKRSDVTSHGRPFSYTPGPVREEEAIAVILAVAQAYLARWTPRASDRYAITYTFWFKTELRADLDNPLKPTNDVLHTSISEALSRLSSKPARSRVKQTALGLLREHTGDLSPLVPVIAALDDGALPAANLKVLWDDNRAVEEILVKIFGGKPEPATIEIRRLRQVTGKKQTAKVAQVNARRVYKTGTRKVS